MVVPKKKFKKRAFQFFSKMDQSIISLELEDEFGAVTSEEDINFENVTVPISLPSNPLQFLDGDALVQIYGDFKQGFELHGRGLMLHEFVATVLTNLGPILQREVYGNDLATTRKLDPELVKYLIEVFKNVDVNGDEEMSWGEFTGMLQEVGMAATAKHAKRAAFFLSFDPLFKDEVTKGSSVVQIAYNPDIDAIVCLERDQKLIRLYTPSLKLARTIDASYAVRKTQRDVDTSELVCHSIVRLREFNSSVGTTTSKTPGYQTMVVALLTNYTIGVWGITRDDCPYFGNLPRISIEHSPRTIFWSTATNLLWVGCSNGRIFGYDVGRKRHVVTCIDPNGHDDVILSMCSMGPKADALYSSALDGKLLLWSNLDPTQGVDGGKPKVRKELKTEPGAVTRKLIFIDAMQMVFGLTSKNSIYAWEAGSAECAIKIDGADIGGIGPRSPRFLDMAECRLSGKPRLITIDSAFIVRVWDVDSPSFGKVKCSFFISCEQQSAGYIPDGIAMTSPPSARPQNWKNAIQPLPPKPMEKIEAEAEAQRKLAAGIEEHHASGHTVGLAGDLIIATAGKMHRFVSAAAERLDPPVGVLFSESLGRFTSIVGQDITMWSADSGKSDDQFTNTIPEDATCFTFDDRQRKVIVGSHSGDLFVNSLMNGSVMKSGSFHKSIVSVIRYNTLDRQVISTSSDGSLCVFDDEPESELKLLRAVTCAHSVEITALAVSSELALIITGDRNGVVKCWDCQDLRLLAVFKEHFTLVTAITTFSAWPFFVSSDVEGQIIICSTRSFGHGGIVKPFRRLYSFRNSVTYEQLGDPHAPLMQEKASSPSHSHSHSHGQGKDKGKTTPSSGVKKVSRKAAQLAILAAMRPPPIDEAAMRKALQEKERLGHLIEAVLEERNMQNNPSGIEESRKRRTRIFQAMKESEADKAHHLAFRTHAIQATRHRLQMQSKTMDFPVLAMESLVLEKQGAHPHLSTLILVTGDDSGRVRVLDLTIVIRRLNLKSVYQAIWPRSLSHYDAHKGMLRDDPGGIVEDDFELNREARSKYSEIEKLEKIEKISHETDSIPESDISLLNKTKEKTSSMVIRGGAEADMAPQPHDVKTLHVWMAHEGSVASLSLFRASHAHTAAVAEASASGAELNPVSGYFVGTTGTDARVFIFDLATGKCVGQLGSTSADNDSWAIGTSQPYKWRFPPLGSAREEAAMVEASLVLGEIKTSPPRFSSNTAASPTNITGNFNSLHQIGAGPSIMTELSSTFEPFSSSSSLASPSLSYEERVQRGSTIIIRDPLAPPRPGHSPVEDATFRHTLEPSYDRVLRDVRLTEAMSKTTAKKELRRAKVLGSSIGISISVGNGPMGSISITDTKGVGGLGFSSDSNHEVLDGDDEEEVEEEEEEEEGVHYDPNEMVTVDDMERMATDDVGALEGTGKDLPAPPTRRLDSEKQSTAAQDLKFVISSAAPAATAAVMFGPGAVAVLSLSGNETSTVQASRAIKKTALAMMELGKDIKGGNKVVQELISRQPLAFQASFSNGGAGGRLPSDFNSSNSFVGVGGGGGSQLTSASATSMSSTVSASKPLPITLLDEESAFAIASAVGGLQQKLSGTLKKISTAYTHLKSEVDRSTLGPLAASQKVSGVESNLPDKLKQRKQPIVSFDVKSPTKATGVINVISDSKVMSATSLYGGNAFTKKTFEESTQPQANILVRQESLYQHKDEKPPSKQEHSSQHRHGGGVNVMSKIDEILYHTTKSYSIASPSSTLEAISDHHQTFGQLKVGLDEISSRLKVDAYKGSDVKARTNTFDSSGSTSMLIASSRADMSILRPMSDSQFKGAAILKEIVATARDSQKSERERVSIGRALGVGSVDDFDDTDGATGKYDPDMPPPPDKVNPDGTKPLVVMPPRFGPYSAVEVIRVRRCFDAADSDGSGDVDLNELLTSAEWRASYSLDQIRNMFDAMDTDKSGKVTIVELFKVAFPNANPRARRLMLAWTDPKRFAKSVEQVARKRVISVKTRLEAEEVFTALDVDRDGRVSLEEIRLMFEENNALIGGTGMGGLNSKDSAWSYKDLLPIMIQYATTDEFDMSSASTSPTKKGVKASSQSLHSKTSTSSPQIAVKPLSSGEIFISRSNFVRLFADNAFELPER